MSLRTVCPNVSDLAAGSELSWQSGVDRGTGKARVAGKRSFKCANCTFSRRRFFVRIISFYDATVVYA